MKAKILIVAIPVISGSIALPALSAKVPTPVIKLPVNRTQAHSRYLRFLEDFNKLHCTSEVEKEFDHLARERRKLNIYVPEVNGGEVDIQTIERGLPEVEKKWKWLIDTRTRLQKMKGWPDRHKIFRSMEATLEKLLRLKEQRFMWGDKSSKVKKESQKLLKDLRNEYESLVEQLFFFQGFGYPVDHLKQRERYENYSPDDPDNHSRKANDIMFLRQLQEDGTYNDQHEDHDMYLRTTLNTLSVRLKNQDDWIDEDVRHDLEWAIRRMHLELRHGKREQLQRIQNWINQVAQVRTFYRNLIKKEGTQEELQQFVNKREASRKLKEFTYTKNARVYKFLLKQDEFTQAYYVFDQILLHEVGRASVYNFRDREEVAQVVVNSRFHPKLSVIDKKEPFYDYLIKAGVDKKALSTPSWLNAMFKSLRFSFTLYYIPAVRHVFCPDYYRTSVETRKKNLFLIWNALKSPMKDFEAIRYFSRWSMVGRIDISEVWSGYKIIPERPGAQYEDDKWLKKKFANKSYRYLYTFEDATDRSFHVLEIGGKTYAVKLDGVQPSFFAYRDSHQFRFFED